ncbi:MAG TPA: SDR family NAD(P)-dependent oxidoreductase [Vicinamibacteria bacterium]|nr:SDR family NAD(P)-dependent oxidoreductase [Vicinamibacteria bacterium]
MAEDRGSPAGARIVPFTTAAEPDRPGMGPEELRRAREVLEAVSRDRSLLAQLPADERRRLLVAAGRTVHPETEQKRRLVKAFRKAKRRRTEAHDRRLVAGTGIRAAREAEVFVPPPRLLQAGTKAAERPPELLKPRPCYVCKAEYRLLHAFYDALCPACAELNYEKRFQTADLRGRVAIVTGARVKIGYQAALKLLRAGATVVATTRFPHDAARRYAAEPDFAGWSSRLVVRGLDLRHTPSVELLCSLLFRELDRLDLLVNNACQTVRRPPGFYEHLLDFEERRLEDLPAELRPLVRAHHDAVLELEGASSTPAGAEGSLLRFGGLVASRAGGAGLGLRQSARLSQARFGFDDRSEDLFPAGARDADLQQVDRRAVNSWRLALAEVSTPEMIEVQLVNAVAPFVLCARLKPLMLRTPGREKHIVNVSAMEGVFSRGTKTDRHPHTNMAKAALNMLTLTSAPDYARDGIHMNAVDTGWITDEDPLVHARRKRDELGFEPPLDVVDGAARVLDPFLSGLGSGRHDHGRFFKDYEPSSW